MPYINPNKVIPNMVIKTNTIRMETTVSNVLNGLANLILNITSNEIRLTNNAIVPVVDLISTSVCL